MQHIAQNTPVRYKRISLYDIAVHVLLSVMLFNSICVCG
jgi:hypothetical protein